MFMATAFIRNAEPHMPSATMLRFCSHANSSSSPATADTNTVTENSVGKSYIIIGAIGLSQQPAGPMAPPGLRGFTTEPLRPGLRD